MNICLMITLSIEIEVRKKERLINIITNNIKHLIQLVKKTLKEGKKRKFKKNCFSFN
jgi:hypothetical protein